MQGQNIINTWLRHILGLQREGLDDPPLVDTNLRMHLTKITPNCVRLTKYLHIKLHKIRIKCRNLNQPKILDPSAESFDGHLQHWWIRNPRNTYELYLSHLLLSYVEKAQNVRSGCVTHHLETSTWASKHF